jgi:hypothetical protein
VKIILAVAIILLNVNAFAEYRVFQYLITDKSNPRSKPSKYINYSTLPPTSFLAYHGSRQSVDIVLSRTWMCPGYTGGRKEICKSPYEKLVGGIGNGQ